MTNVLPPDAERALGRIYRARFIVAGSAVALLAALLSALSLLPSYLALHADEETPSEQTERVASAKDQEDIRRTQAILTVFAPLVEATTTPSAALARALSLRPSGVIVDHISYTPGSLVLAGLSKSREGVGIYRKALAADPTFSSVVVPIGDLAGAQGGRFSMTLSGRF